MSSPDKHPSNQPFVKKRAVITGIGILSPVGIEKDEVARSLKAGTSGVAPITLFDASSLPTTIAAEVKDFNPQQMLRGAKVLDMTGDRRVLFANASALLAVEDAGLAGEALRSARGGVVLGAGMHSLVPRVEMIHAQGMSFGSEKEMKARAQGLEETANAPLWNRACFGTLSVAKHFAVRGPCYTVVSACAASSEAVGQSLRMIQRNDADFIITGGYDSMLNPFFMEGFCGLGTMSVQNDTPREAMKPFDRRRDGFVLGEGAGVIILEEYEHALRRGATIYAEVAGYGTSLDAYSVADPHPEGTGAVLAMTRAIKDAGIAITDVAYINAHGTATMKNDRIETAAIKKVFSEHAYQIPVSSTKSMIGHTVAAAGILELIATVLGMNHDFIPPTINYQTPDPDCDLDYVPNHARERAFSCALSNSFGFGGQNSTLIIKKV
jgi:3-oxoacyl-[acyl-carrier-protein] synthase II